MSDQITPQGGDTAAELKMKIEKMQAESKETKGSAGMGSSLADGKTPESSNSSKSNAMNSESGATTSQTSKASKSDGATTTPQERVDLQKWAQSKGIDWTSDTSVLEALRRSDQEFHKRQSEKRTATPNIPAPTYNQNAPAQNGNANQPYSQQQGYVPPPMQMPRHALEQIARQYNLPPEDAERLINFSNDFMETKLNIERQRMQKEFDELRTANKKNDVFRELSTDPTFRNPQVIHEYYRTLEELQDQDPRSFEEDPNAYRRAYDQALINIARRNLQGETSANGKNFFMPPSSPPRSIGTGGTGETARESELSREDFARLSVEDQRSILSRMGLVSSKY